MASFKGDHTEIQGSIQDTQMTQLSTETRQKIVNIKTSNTE